MNNEEFEKILDRRLQKIKETLARKAGEYASDQDRLYNFKRAAQMDGITPAEALWGMKRKHMVSVVDLVEGRVPVTEKLIDDKIGDDINYLILLEAVLKEEISEKI